MVDVNDLRPFKANEFRLDSYYYIKQDDGSFNLAITYKEEWDKWPEEYRHTFRQGMKFLSAENRLYVSINNPWINPISIRV